MTAAACPSDADLLALLEDALDPTAASTIEEHVNGCPVCEKRLGRIVPDGAGLLLLQAHLDSDGCGLPTLPGYETLGILGRGAMGVVYEARHIKLDRVVALKMVTESKGRDAVLMARFFAEAQAVAAVNHPNVVEVYDFGEADGRAFLAMELLGGGTFAERLRARPVLAPREAAAKIEQIARGVGAAHDAEIVHRDLKPGNVMFAADGTPKVTDFGLAKRATSDLTATQAIVGTPNYMAPEQASGKGKFVGPTADVWALGVMLFECLVGRRPFESGDAMSLLAKIVNENPPRIRVLVRGLPRELDVIVSKCLAKEPGERYGSANKLADDLRRYQDGLPILAKPAGVAERAYKWAKRNPGWAAMTTFLMLSMLTGTAVSLFYADQANKNARRAEANATEANDQKTLALAAVEQEKRAKNREAVQRVRAEKAADKATQVLDVVVSDITGDSLATQKTITAEQKKLLTEVLPYYRQFLGQKADEEKSRARLARAAFRVGVIEYRLGRKEEGAAAIRQARDCYETLATDFKAVPEYRLDLANSHTKLGFLLAGLGKQMEAEVQCREGLTVFEKLFADFPAVLKYRSNLATSHSALGLLLAGQGKRPEAEEQYRKGLAILEELVTDFPAVPEYRQHLGAIHSNVGQLLAGLGKQIEAEVQYRKGLAVQQKLVADFPTLPEYRSNLALSHTNLGALLSELGNVAAAAEQFRKGLAIQDKLAADFPAVPEYHSYLAASHTNLGLLLALTGQRPEAEVQYRKGLAIREKLASDFPAVPEYRRDLAASYTNLGTLIRDGGNPADSLEWFGKAIATLRPVHEAEPHDVTAKEYLLSSYGERANAYDRIQKFAEAVKDWDRAIELSPKERQPAFRASRAVSRLNAGTGAEAVAEVAELTKLPNWNAAQWYDFACVYAVASGKIADKKAEYTDRAMELLRKAVEAGYKDGAHLKQDKDLDPLRERDDYKKLLAELQKE